ncbi:pentatricopeptide repeat-containing protein At5g15340, mitochondrial [Pistacia vera]|uniref:pentatricopeptide repeat-containing protein At5g15340, mitochondrial n=1 Tax=Pistacia vera TaxID=55513 RepID=UPI001262C710|nr:pentatricopeptide repeat-containing protein At5g15340, mitochondrial [Pistacia vera]
MRWPIYHSLPRLSVRSFRSLLRACARQPSLASGKILHAVILTTGLSSIPNAFLLNPLLHLYAACGATLHARKLFDQIPPSHKDTADWTALIGCLARHGMPQDAISLFAKMRKENVGIDGLTMTCLLSLCAGLRDLHVGVQGHACVVKMGLGFNVRTCNTLMDIYGKCGLVNEVRSIFTEMEVKSVVSWTVVLDGVVKWEGVEKGRLVFDELPERNEVAWTIMIVGYVESGYHHEGFSLLGEMVLSLGHGLNSVTLCSILSACAQSGDMVMGRWVHVYALKAMGKEIDVKVGTALVDMYAKCGRIDTAFKVFEYMPLKNVVAWNAMLNGLAMHGWGKTVLEMFSKMIEEVKPNELTFMAVLSGCSHSGLVDQGWQYFHSIESVYGLTPKVEHYACMVDLLGRVGRLEEAENLIKRMPMPPNEVVLGSLLGSCSVHGKLQLGERVLQELIQMDPHNTEYHILLSNMYASAGKHGKANSLRQVLKNKGIKKVPGMSSIHVAGKAHQFSAGDKSHPQTREIYSKLDEMIWSLRLAGYTPNTASQVLCGEDMEE